MNPQEKRSLPAWGVGLIAVVVIAVAFYGAFTKSLPWSSSYEIKAVFANAQNLAVNSPVRIAGVGVGKVTGVAHVSSDGEGKQAAVVTMAIQDQGRPIKTDSTMQLRPRLFLEGNYFVDTKPGTPEAPEASSGYTIPVSQTSTSVQFDQVLTALQSNTRDDLDILLRELGNAFEKYGGANGFNEFYKTSPGANKSSAQVNEALLGTQPHDLSQLIVGIGKVVRGLDTNEAQLQDLVTNFRIVTGSFAAQSGALEQAIIELPRTLDAAQPALVSLNAAFPPLRAFAREILPGVRSSGPTLDVATPFIHQVRLLVSQPELRGLANDLARGMPSLTKLTRRTIPFLEQTRALSSCFNNVIIPWGDDTVQTASNAPDPAVGPVYKETGYGLVGLAGESRSGDANGQYIRVGAGGGTNTVIIPANPSTGRPLTAGITPFAILGAEPTLQSSLKTPFKPTKPCENQQTPDLRFTAGPSGSPPTQTRHSGGRQNLLGIPKLDKIALEAASLTTDYFKLRALGNSGKSKQQATLLKTLVPLLKAYAGKDLPTYQQAFGAKAPVKAPVKTPAGGGP